MILPEATRQQGALSTFDAFCHCSFLGRIPEHAPELVEQSNVSCPLIRGHVGTDLQ